SNPTLSVPHSPYPSVTGPCRRNQTMHEHDGDLDPDLDTQEPDAAITARVGSADAGTRLDVFAAAALPGATRSEARRLIELPPEIEEGVRVNGRREKPGYRLPTGDLVTAHRPDALPTTAQPEPIPLTIVYEDADLLVIDKP